ncbi:MAG: peptide chain release factor-like protein [Nitrospirales bacterium]
MEREVMVEAFRSGGPGGQHRNVTDSAVRLRHVPSGVRVTAADSRSQTRNKDIAFARLIERLRELNRVRKPRVPTRATKSSVERRIHEKKQQQKVKRRRGSVDEDQ